MSKRFPGASVLGRGVVIADSARAPASASAWPEVVVDEDTLVEPGIVVDTLHRHWLTRDPLTVRLVCSLDALREEPERSTLDPWRLTPSFAFARERLAFLVTANNYDARSGQPVWGPALRATALGARLGGRRRQRALGRLTPVEFELAFTPPPCLEDDQAA